MLPRKFQISIALVLVALCVGGAIGANGEPISCYQCDGDECEDQISQQCAAEDDKCYMRFDPLTFSVVDMGCVSAFANEDEVVALIKQKVLLLCDTSNCNGYDSLPSSNECSACTSGDLEACAINPANIKSRKSCRTLPYTECYERVSGSATERGCLADLEGDEFYACLTGSDAACSVCKSTHCNENIIPIDRQRCQRCDSESDPTCLTQPSATSVCPLYSANEVCVATHEDGVTRRGCGTELTCNTSSKGCQVCSANSCNTANLKKRVEDIFGAFQDLPLNCYTCSGDECKEGVGVPRKCEGDDYQDCLTVFSAEGEVLSRGCDNLVLAEHDAHCQEHPELCFNCKANGCNTVSDAKQYQECLYCDAATNADCLFQPSSVSDTRKCPLGCISSLYVRKSNPEVRDFVRTCLDDIEPDDRDACTPENNCVRCSDNECNTDILPAEPRLSCYHCDGSDCDAPQAKQCVGYAADDQCYMFFSNVTKSVERMGCRSDYSKADILADVKQFFICDGDNCNNYDNLPESKMCVACDSANDPNCAADATKVTTLNRCGTNPYTECYTRVRPDGHTQRGCVYDLPIEEFKSCQSGNPDAMCRICTDSECNRNVYPSSRPRCYRCDSTTDENCEAAPTALQACPLYKEEEDCVTQLVAGVTRRACASELSCEGLDRKNCRTCSTNGCNDVNLAENNVGPAGIFTDLPLTCLHCSGADECKDEAYYNVCTGNPEQTCTVAFNSEGVVVARGCSDTLEEVCEDGDNRCYECKSNGCNSATSKDDYVQCIFCDASEGDDCAFNVAAIGRSRMCHGGCMTALYARTKDAQPVYELTRTCLDDKDPDDRDACTKSLDPKCKSCTDPLCNTDDLGERKSCYQCKGDECQDAKAQQCRAVMDNDQCFTQVDETGTVTELGCKSQYDPADVAELVSAQLMLLCDDDDCNHFDNLPKAQSCAICSSRSNAKCATDPSTLVSETTCASGLYTQCYSRILEDGNTERGCLSSLQSTDFLDCLHNANSTKCQSCIGNNCNKEIFPTNRPSCHVCTSDDTAACETLPNDSQVCLLYSNGEKCVTSLDASGVTIRGCSSQVECDASAPQTCQHCEGNDCNVVNLKRKSDGKPGQWQSLPLSCLTCNSLDACATSSAEQTCTNEEYCITVFNNEGAVLSRGCSNAVEQEHGAYCDSNSQNCFNCNSNLCNNARLLDDYTECIYCDSEVDANCAIKPSAVSARRRCNGNCMTALRPVENSSSYEVVRSCLDDKDAEDQKQCSAEDSTTCKACSGSACNTQTLPEDRASCYTCAPGECGDAEPAPCPRYTPNEQCYMLFDNKSDITQMGCLSDLDDSFVANNIHLLHICSSGDNCNSFDNVPTTTLCAVCDSNNDPDCASLPSNVPGVQECTMRPNTQCYTRTLSDGSTARGCVSSLKTADMLSCLAGNSSDCITCDSDKCNVEIFPEGRRQCQRCNSLEDPSCESSPNAESVCPVLSSSQFCATKVVDGHTYRGCSTEFVCDDSDKQYCRLCHEADNCNTVNLAINDIGYPGKWQGQPINCYSCRGADCRDTIPGIIGKCENNNLQNCATVFAANGSVVARGCSDHIYNSEYLDYCDQNPGLCKFCKSSGCNEATSLTDYQDCLFCDGRSSRDCVFQPEKISRTRECHKGCITALYARSDEQNPAYEVARTCLDDMDLDQREACKEGKDPYCKFCEAESCNEDIIPSTRLHCNVCNGDCSEPQSTECSAFRENDQCFTLFENENDVQRMGCASDFDTSELLQLRRQLLLCDGDNCNTFDSLPATTACRWCNSTVDPNCATDPDSPIATVCHVLPHTECFTRIDIDGSTHRGCLADLPDDLFDDCRSGDSSTCELCSVNNCNSVTYPEGRRSCIQCDSDADPSCAEEPQKYAKICPTFAENDKCVTKLEAGRTVRGCASDFTCDTSSRDTCRICNSTDNCNTVNLLAVAIGPPGKWQGLPLTCYHCEGEECLEGSGALNVCTGNNLQTCTTVFDATGAVVARGCSDTVEQTHAEYCEENPDHCPGCKSVGCNTPTSLDDYSECYFCDSAESAHCAVGFDSTKASKRRCHGGCMTALYARSSSNDPSYELARTCLDDMDLDDREQCLAGTNAYCKACTDALCNTDDVPEERFECYKCLDADCEDMEPQTCSSYHPNDQCYTLFNNESSIIAMGCRSEFEMGSVTELVKQKHMLLCDAKNCNSPDDVPLPKVCSVCDSRQNPLCATNPNLVANTERCSALPYTECFTRVDSSGHTERGCLASLETDVFYNCTMGLDGLCEKCMGDKCNEIDVFPADRRKCHQCSSATDPLCASAPNSNKVCLLYDEDEQCVTSFQNGITTRGCSSSMKCEYSEDKRTCRYCFESGCNTVDLEKANQDGAPGKWQTLPISCYHCKGEEECSSLGQASTCVNNRFQNCMTVFDASGKVTERGCSDDVEDSNASYCESNSDKCFRCNSNNCNVAESTDDYIECVACDSASGGHCVSDVASVTTTRKCYKQCMTALYPLFEEENPSMGLSRSCYDDMDAEDRESCAAGTKDNCQTCADSKCNTVAMPEKRISCYQCTGDDCQDPQASVCPTYRPDDQCYVRFDETRAVVSLGCHSEFSHEDAHYLLQEKRLYLCDGENCNHFDQLPSAQSCVLCNSRTDANCAQQPEDVKGLTTCSALPYTECYTRVLSDGATERGCLSNLVDDEFLSCLNGTSATCASCKGNACNSKVFPADRLMCHICDSESDANCEAHPDSLGICRAYEADDVCVTAFRNGVTYRGCGSDLVCDATNPRKCAKCSGEGCNTVDLAKKQDDNFGRWQDLPLTCLSCTGTECDATASTTSTVCELNNEQDCVTVFDANNKVVRRGCSDAVEKDYGSYCDANDGSCFSCKSNECNTAVAKTEFVECVYCDTHKDVACLWDPTNAALKTRQCQGGCMTALYPSDGSAAPSYDLVRSCLNDKEQKDQQTCSDGKDSECHACSEGKCNTDALPQSRLSCYSCTGVDCEEPQPQPCPLYKEDDQCYIRVDESNSVAEMGCLSSFRNQQLESIIKTKRVLVCSGENCNSPDIIPTQNTCASCSSLTDASCAVQPLQVGEFATCSSLPYTGCFSKLQSDGSTSRGCLTDLPDDDFVACVLGKDEDCGVCSGDGCNREIFPANRQQCYTCSSDEEPNCESFPTSMLPCATVSDTETCVTALSGNVTYRGCKSSLHCDENDSSSCRSCLGTECNSIDLRNKVDDGYHGMWQDLPLRCHTCEGSHCLNSLGPAVTCSSRNVDQDCMTVFSENGEVSRRGCSDDVEDYSDLYCRQHPHLCFKCKSNECNYAWNISDYVECAFCDSETDPLCVLNPESAGFASRECYSQCMVAMKEQRVIRSCLDDKELRAQHTCEGSEGAECATCREPECNKFVYPSDRLKCHSCTGASCTSSVGQYCLLYEATDYCFARYDSGKVSLMGCASSQNASDINEWKAEGRLYTCEGNDCNELSRLPEGGECLACDSSKTRDCAQNPQLITSTEQCPAPSNRCVTRVNAQGDTIRGCFGSLSASEQSCEAAGTCAVCSGSKCNNEIYPANRRSCHICNSVANNECRDNPNSAQICPVYAANDNCVSSMSEDGVVTRGCASEVACESEDSDYCDVCTTDNCNTVQLKGAAAALRHSLLLTLFAALAAIASLQRKN